MLVLDGRPQRRAGGIRGCLVILAAGAVVAAGCGSRLTEDEIAAKATMASPSESVSDAGGLVSAGDRSESHLSESHGAGPGPGSSNEGVDVDGSDAVGNETAGGSNVSGKDVEHGQTSGTPIVIGTVASLSGSQRPGVVAVRAWVESVNAQGGINGHPIVHVVRDDANDPARNASAVRDLVENEGVIAFVGNYASLSNHGSAAYLAKRGIPVVGGDASTELWWSNPMFFPQTVDYRSVQVAALELLSSMMEDRNLGTLVCQEAQVCSDFEKAFNDAAAKTGWTVVYNGKGSIVQPDFTSNCLAARSRDVDVLGIGFDGPSTKRIARSCSDQGYRPKYILPATIDTTYAHEDFEGAVIPNWVFPFVGSGLAAAGEFEDTMGKYAPNEPLGGVAAIGWTAAKLFERVAQGVGDTPDTADILDGLYSLRADTLDGLTIPLTFERGAPATPVACAFMMAVKGGQLVAVDGARPRCEE